MRTVPARTYSVCTSRGVCLYIVRRTQIYLDERQTALLDTHAASEGVTRSTLVRQAVAEYLAKADRDPTAWQTHWQEAVRETAGIAPYLEDGVAYVERVREEDTERLTELDR